MNHQADSIAEMNRRQSEAFVDQLLSFGPLSQNGDYGASGACNQDLQMSRSLSTIPMRARLEQARKSTCISQEIRHAGTLKSILVVRWTR